MIPILEIHEVWPPMLIVSTIHTYAEITVIHNMTVLDLRDRVSGMLRETFELWFILFAIKVGTSVA